MLFSYVSFGVKVNIKTVETCLQVIEILGL